MIISNYEILEKRPEPFGSMTPWSLAPQLSRMGKDGPELLDGHNPRAKSVGNGRRILIIEDDPSSRELYELLLQAFGFATNLASNGEEGLAKAQNIRPDLILCDIQLPRLGGVEVMQRLKADPSLRRIPIIALTIFSSEGHRERLLAAGFDGYMAKPTIPEDFIQEIEDFFSHNKSN
ncbi:MAG: response regulator [Syntrophales bacterium]|nr:response regulator [Syntrophales bacterium]